MRVRVASGPPIILLSRSFGAIGMLTVTGRGRGAGVYTALYLAGSNPVDATFLSCLHQLMA